MFHIRCFLRSIDWINEKTGRLVSFFCFFIMVIVSYEVLVRYVFSRPTIWASEINQYLLCGYSALAGGYAFLHKSHVTVDIAYQRFNLRRRAFIDVFTSFFTMIFILVLGWTGAVFSWDALKFSERSESLLAFPLFPVKVIIPLGALLIFLQVLAKLIRDLMTLVGIEGERPATEMRENEGTEI
jgi:TRAP-type mannitol/chloroaromatic compound transport system permease small subunit